VQAGFTQMFEALGTAEAAVPQPAVEPPAQPVAAPGSFTQIFQSLDAQTPPTPPAAAPGSFTQMFRSVDSQPTDTIHPPAPLAAATPDATGISTQMFSTLSAPENQPQRVDAPPARPEAGSFTQLFGTMADTTPPAQSAPQGTSFASPGAGRGPGADFGTSGASQIFSTPRSTPEPARSPAFSPSPSAPPSTPSSGGLTQLLRTLDRAPQPPTPHGASAASQPSGPFTSVYSSLDQGGAYAQPGSVQPQAFHAPSAPTPPSAPAVGAGPSEFTRILNASTLREGMLRSGGAAPAGTASPAAQPAPAMGLPHVAMPHIAAPVMPAMSSGGGTLHLQPPHLGVHAPAVPHLPAVPQIKVPAAGKMQQMLPLLLILIIFLLIAVLVAVVILMKH
jgi:hypothetical protein